MPDQNSPLPAVTYALDCGRFGDQLINYIKALWVSWKYDLPLLYKPFSYSEELVLSQAHLFFQEKGDLEAISFHSEMAPLNKVLYVVSYYTPFIEEWEDEAFRNYLQGLVKPLKKIKPLRIPKGRIAVAIHVRRGGGYDCCQSQAPTKFPPDTFYLNGLKRVADHFKGKSLYVHIFTDDRKPKRIIDKFFKELKNWGITNNVRIGGRTKKNRHDKMVLEDFFAMAQFDCLIRPDSSFSRAVGALSGPSLEITPLGVDCRKDELGDPIRDKEGNVIVDNWIKFRPQKGKNVSHTQVALIDSSMLYTQMPSKVGF